MLEAIVLSAAPSRPQSHSADPNWARAMDSSIHSSSPSSVSACDANDIARLAVAA